MRSQRARLSDEELDARLIAADRAQSGLSDERSQALLSAGIAQGRGEREPRQRRFGLFAGAILGLTVLAGAVAVPSVADTLRFLTEDVVENSDPLFAATPAPAATTTEDPTAPTTPESKPDLDARWVNPAASDYVAWAMAAYDLTLPQPPGIVLEEAATQHAQGWHDTILRNYGSGGIVVEALSQKGAWEQAVQCLWIEEWLDADSNDNSQRRSTAGTALVGSLEWPGLRFGDDPQDATMAEYWRVAGEAFMQGDRSGIRKLRASSQCNGIVRDIER
jgi:hypothetical protein